MRTITTLRVLSLPLLASFAAAVTCSVAVGCAASSASPDGACTGESCSDAGASNDGGNNVPTVDAACVPTSDVDRPDDDFNDTNCDGIDGDRTHAIFVALTGVDTANGSLETPVKTVTKAVALAAASKKDVYLCNATYDDAITLTSAVSIYGGFDCANAWRRVVDRATLAPRKGTPLTIQGVTAPVTIDRIALRAADAFEPSASSIAAFVATSPSVSFTHDSFEAGNGADGSTAPAPASLTYAATSGNNGRSLAQATCSRTSPSPQVCAQFGAGGFDLVAAPACEGQGGTGGNGGNVFTSTTAQSGAAGAPIGAGASSPGHNGSDGTNGVSGTSATAGTGSINASGYVASNAGTDGTDGTRGGGGAGGTGGISRYADDVSPIFDAGGGGGVGGNGGCAGLGGKSGGAGGASIALLVFDSGVKVTDAQMKTANGGRGGASVAGATGQLGGEGGVGGYGTRSTSIVGGNAMNGGRGGRGGNGGAGGAGGGGPSIAIFSNAQQVVTSAVRFNLGAGGKGGTGAGLHDGADGAAVETLSLTASDAGSGDGGH